MTVFEHGGKLHVRKAGGYRVYRAGFSTAEVEDFSEMLLFQQSYAIKNLLGRPKTPTTTYNGSFCCLLACSLYHKDAYNRSFPVMEIIKNQRESSKMNRFYVTRLLA